MNTYDEMDKILISQKDYFIKNGSPDNNLRIDRLKRLKTLIMDNRYHLVDALNEDFGNRSKDASLMSDIYSVIPSINYAIKNIHKWTKVEKRNYRVYIRH